MHYELINDLIKEHFEMTNSELASYLLSDFENNLKHMIKVYPRDYKKAIENKINELK